MRMRHLVLGIILYTAAVSLVTARAIQVFNIMPGSCGAGKSVKFHIARKDQA